LFQTKPDGPTGVGCAQEQAESDVETKTFSKISMSAMEKWAQTPQYPPDRLFLTTRITWPTTHKTNTLRFRRLGQVRSPMVAGNGDTVRGELAISVDISGFTPALWLLKAPEVAKNTPPLVVLLSTTTATTAYHPAAGVTHATKTCAITAGLGWPGTAAGSAKVKVKAGAVTGLFLVCK